MKGNNVDQFEQKAFKNKIDAMTHEEMCWLYRFARSGHVFFISGTELAERFDKRYKKFGCMIAEMSKRIGL